MSEENTKFGGPSWGKNKCPDCGKIEKRYYLGSWDWQPEKCFKCWAKDINKMIDDRETKMNIEEAIINLTNCELDLLIEAIENRKKEVINEEEKKVAEYEEEHEAKKYCEECSKYMSCKERKNSRVCWSCRRSY